MGRSRLQIYPAPPVLKEQEQFPDTISKRMATIVDRYQGLIERYETTVKITEQDRYKIAACLDNYGMDANEIDTIGKRVAEKGHSDLGRQLDSMNYLEKIVILESLPYDAGKLAYATS